MFSRCDTAGGGGRVFIEPTGSFLPTRLAPSINILNSSVQLSVEAHLPSRQSRTSGPAPSLPPGPSAASRSSVRPVIGCYAVIATAAQVGVAGAGRLGSAAGSAWSWCSRSASRSPPSCWSTAAALSPRCGRRSASSRRRFTEGGEVKAGQVLYQIDPATYRAAHDSARPAPARAEASLQTARPQGATLQGLVAIKAVSQQEADDAAAALQQGDADVAAARAAVESARINLGYTAVTSPISGRIGKSTVTEARWSPPTRTAALATVQKLDPVYVDVTQSSGSVLRLRRAFASGTLQRASDTAARVKLLLEDGAVPAGRQAAVHRRDRRAVDRGVVCASCSNPKGETAARHVRPRHHREGVRENAITVPQQAVTRDGKGDARRSSSVPTARSSSAPADRATLGDDMADRRRQGQRPSATSAARRGRSRSAGRARDRRSRLA